MRQLHNSVLWLVLHSAHSCWQNVSVAQKQTVHLGVTDISFNSLMFRHMICFTLLHLIVHRCMPYGIRAFATVCHCKHISTLCTSLRPSKNCCVKYKLLSGANVSAVAHSIQLNSLQSVHLGPVPSTLTCSVQFSSVQSKSWKKKKETKVLTCCVQIWESHGNRRC